MKKYRWVCLTVFLVIMVGCGKKVEESIPLVSDTVLEEEEVVDKTVVEGDLKDIEFAIKEDMCKLPLKYEDAVNMGWKYNDDNMKEVEGESYIKDQIFEVDGQEIVVEIANFSIDKLPVQQCYIASVSIDMTDNNEEEVPVKVALPNGITMLESTIVQAEDTYGEPKDKYEGEDKLMLTYEYGMNKLAVLTFDSKTEVLVAVGLYNRQNPEDEELLKAVAKKPTAEVEKYQKPEVMSDDFEDYVVSYDSVLYRLPAPVTEFVGYGWEIQKDKSDKAVKAGKYGYVTLSKNGQNLYVVVYNADKDATVISNCFVTSIYADLTVTKVPIGITKGITLGMDQETCQKALKGCAYEQEENEETGTVTYYIYGDEEKLNYTSITIDCALQMVSAIKVVHYPAGVSKDSNDMTEAMEHIALVQKGN